MGGEEHAEIDERRLFFGGSELVRADDAEPPHFGRRGRLRWGRRFGKARDWTDIARSARAAFEAEIDRGTPFLCIPVFIGAGALTYFALPREPALLPLTALVFGLLSLWWWLRAQFAWRLLAMSGLLVALGALSAKVETLTAGTRILGSEVTTRLTGRVELIEQQASGRVRLTLRVLDTQRPVLRHAPDIVRVTASSMPENAGIGEVIEGVVRLIPPSGPVRPYSYDFSFQSYFSGIGAIGFFMGVPEIVEGEWPEPALWMRAKAWIETLRQKMATRITETIGGPEGAIAAALITGIRAGIPEEINEALRITGLYHVISISGLHMALVGGTLMVALRSAFALAPNFAMRRPVKKYAAVIALLAAAFYLLISGADVAAQRSFIMLAVMLLAIVFDRAALTMRNLAISAIIILLLSPHEVAGPSFQMSFAATAALVASYAAWTSYRAGQEPRRRRSTPSFPGRIVRYGFAAAIALATTSIIAGGATALFSAWHFQQVSPLGLFANLAAMPIVSVVVMPMAVAASILMPLGLDALPLIAMGEGIAAVITVAQWLAERSFYDSTGAIPGASVLLLAAGLAILTMSQTSLCWLAAAPIAVGLTVLVLVDARPDVLIAEDGRLVAMRRSDGAVAVNQSRPRGFALENWQRAMRASAVIGPQPEDNPLEHGFVCAAKTCTARHESGNAIVYTADQEAARDACGRAALLVLADATSSDPCPGSGTLTLTTRDLAVYGAAEVRFDAQGRAQIRYAISMPYRPWHDHRRFSRAARGLPERTTATQRAAGANNETKVTVQ